MKLLMTGSTGFVGRNLLLKLIGEERNRRIILPVRDPEKLKAQLVEEGIALDDLGDRVEIIKVSRDAWELPVSVQPDLVIHAAGKLFGREREGYFMTNVTGTLNLASQLPKFTRMIVLSSLAAGGPTPIGAAFRTTAMKDMPVSYYGESKLAMETALREKLGSRLLLLRPPMVLGPRDAATVPLFQMAKGLVLVKPGFRPKHYSWIAVDDLCEALLTAATSSWPDYLAPFYLSASNTITDSQLLVTAAEVISSRGVTLPIPESVIQLASIIFDSIPSWREAVPSMGRDRVKEILPNRWVCEGEEFSKYFNWKPLRGLTETLKATADFLKLRGTS